MKLTLALVFALVLIASAQTTNYGNLPLSFEPNRGQTDARVQFVARGAGYTLFLSPTTATFALPSTVIRMNLLDVNPNSAIEPYDKLPGIASYLTGSRTSRLPTYAKTHSRNVYPGIDLVYYGTQGRLEYDFVIAPHANPSKIRLQFEGAIPAVDASGDLIVTGDVRFRKPLLYQQVDGVRHPVTGTFVIASNHNVGFRVGAYDHNRELVIDPVLVYSSYLGGSSQNSAINAMAVDAAGDIYVTGYTSTINFPTTPGVIEPTCPAGNTQLGAPAGVPKCGEGESGTPAAFVSKISADGQTLIYSTYLGGGGNGAGLDLGTGIAVDAAGNAWVVGQTQSNDFPVTPDAYLSYCNPVAQSFNFSTLQNQGEISGCIGNSTRSVFLIHLNPSGTTLLYGTFLGGSGDELAPQIALDAAGNIYVAGSTHTNNVGPQSTVFPADGQFNYPTTASAYQPIVLAGNSYSAFVTEFAPDGKSLLYSTLFGGPYANTYNNALAVAAGKIFIGGYTTDPKLPTTPGALSTTCIAGPTPAGPNTICQGAYTSGWVAEFDPSKSGAASLVFSTYLNGATPQNASSVTALAADTAGNVYAAGTDAYPDFPTTPGVLQPVCYSHGGCGTGFVTKLSSSGSLVWSTFYGSPSSAGGTQTVSAIAVDANRNVYITANSSGLGDYPLNNSIQGYASGVAYVTELSSDGSQVLFGSFYGGANNVFPTSLAVDPAGNIYFAGYTAGGLPLVNAYQGTDAGGSNQGFFAKISNPPPGPATFVSAASSQPGGAAPGSIVSAYGSDLATETGSASTTPLPMSLAGTTVNIVDSTGVAMPAPLFFVSPGQVNFLVPSSVANGSASIAINSGDGKISTGKLTIATVAPGLFTVNSAGLAAADVITVEADGTQVSTNTYQTVNGAIVPLPINLSPPSQVVLVLFGTGISGGSAATAAVPNVTVSIGGLSLPAVYAGPQGDAGLDQVNVQLPASLAGNGDTTISVMVNGVASNTVHVTIM